MNTTSETTPHTQRSDVVGRYRHPLIFFGASLIGSAALWLLAGWLGPGTGWQLIAFTVLLTAGLVFPFLVAMVLAARDRAVWTDFRARLLRLTPRDLRYAVLGAAILLASILVAQAISLLFGYSVDQFRFSEGVGFQAGLASGLFVLIIAPIVEELSWHSYGTDALRARFSLFWTSIIFAIYWVAWHAPLSGVPGLYQAEVVETGWLFTLNFAVSLFPFVLLMNWLYYRSDRSVFVAVVFHLSGGIFNEMFQTEPMSKVIQTGLLLVLTVVVIVMQPRMFFRRSLTDLGTATR